MTHSTKCFEDFVIGDIVPLGDKTLSRDEIVAYARDFDPSPAHLDEIAAKCALSVRPGASGQDLVALDGLVASSWHVGAMFMRTFFDALLAGASSRGSPGIETLDWPNPVRPGDMLRFSLEVMETKTSRSRPDMGLVLFDILGVNQLGDPVLVARCWTMFGRRDAGATDLATKAKERSSAASEPGNSASAALTAHADAGSLWFDDIETGATVELGSHHFDADGIIRFARAFDPQPFHVSEEAGKASIFGGLAASGWQSAAIWQWLTVAHEVAARGAAAARGEPVPPDVLMPGITDLRWLKPVLAGDTISYRTIVTGKALSETNAGWGVVRARAEGFNQRGDLVFHLTARRFAKLKP